MDRYFITFSFKKHKFSRTTFDEFHVDMTGISDSSIKELTNVIRLQLACEKSIKINDNNNIIIHNIIKHT